VKTAFGKQGIEKAGARWVAIGDHYER